MNPKEEPMVAYYDDPAHFADLMNGWIYRGTKQLMAEQILEADTRYTAKSQRNYRTRYRNIAKRIQNIRILLVVGTEIQTYVDYSMPVRGMDYDAVEYKCQISRMNSNHKKEEISEMSLSPILKEDRLIPTITLVLYMGEKPWDAASNLYDILDMSDISEEWKSYVQNYKVHVLDICHTPDERLLEFPQKTASLFLSIKYARNKEKLSELVKKFSWFRGMDEETYDTVWNYVGNKRMLEMKKINEQGGVDMRCAIDEIYEDGIAEGEKRGLEIGEARGEARGTEWGIRHMLKLLKSLGYSAESAATQLAIQCNLPDEQAREYLKKYWNAANKS